jgi:hypothetical protein
LQTTKVDKQESMKSYTGIPLAACLLAFSLLCCQFNQSGQNSGAAAPVQDNASENIGEQDLLDLLQGDWVADSLPGARLEVREDTIWRYDPQEAPFQGRLMIDSRCEKNSCFDSLLLDNWCFVVENAQGVHCYRVLNCSPDSLVFHSAGSAENVRRYHRKP